MTAGVYWIYQTSRDRAVYVGGSGNLERRLKDHRHTLSVKTHFNRYLQRVWDRYGESDFLIAVLELCEKDKLVEREQFWMDALSPSCNVALAADSPHRGRTLSAEHRMKISLSWKTRVVSDETRRKISLSLKGKTKGRKRTPEQNLKNSMAHKAIPGHPNKYRGVPGYPVSDEIKAKISKTLKGHVHSEETRKKISLSGKGKHVQKHTEQAKAMISQTLLGHAVSAETRAKISETKRGKPWTKARRDAQRKSG